MTTAAFHCIGLDEARGFCLLAYRSINTMGINSKEIRSLELGKLEWWLGGQGKGREL
jgi:hypothetical protein